MATTLGQLLGRTRFALSGLGSIEDAQAELTSAVAADATVLAVDDASNFSPGVIEIDFERIRVRAVDSNANTLTTPSYGRGYEGSLATAHASGAQVSFNPLWPKSVVAEHINGVLTEIYPDLYAVASTETTVPSEPGAPVTLPAGTVGVIAVYLEPRTVPDTWELMDRWDYQPDAELALHLGLGYPGQAVRVVYAKRPGTFSLTTTSPLTQDFETVTGLPERMADLVALGVAARLAPFIHLSRMPVSGAEARAEGGNKPADGLSTSARLLYSEFRARVQAEQMALVKEHPIRPHKVGR